MNDAEPVPEHLAPLGPWLEPRIPGADAVELRGARAASSGFSADTTILDTAVTRGGAVADERYVLRTESPEPPIYPVQVPGWEIEIELQFRIMDALGHHSSVPVAPMLGFERDPAVLGAPFFVMGFVDGNVPVESPPYTTEGFFCSLAPADRTRMIEQGLTTLAARARCRLARRRTRVAGPAREPTRARRAGRAVGGVPQGRAARPRAPARRPRRRVAAS